MAIKWREIAFIIIWIILVIVTWQLSLNNLPLVENPHLKVKYYAVWTLGALISIIIFGGLYAYFYIVDLQQKFKRAGLDNKFKPLYRGGIFLSFMLLVLLVVAIVKFVILYNDVDLSKESKGIQEIGKFINDSYTQQGLQVITVIFFTFFDILVLAGIHKGLKSLSNNKQELEHEGSVLWKMIFFVDLPSVITLSLLLLYFTQNNNLNEIHKFVGGSEAFALLSFNIIYIFIILEVDFKKVFKIK